MNNVRRLGAAAVTALLLVGASACEHIENVATRRIIAGTAGYRVADAIWDDQRWILFTQDMHRLALDPEARRVVRVDPTTITWTPGEIANAHDPTVMPNPTGLGHIMVYVADDLVGGRSSCLFYAEGSEAAYGTFNHPQLWYCPPAGSVLSAPTLEVFGTSTYLYVILQTTVGGQPRSFILGNTIDRYRSDPGWFDPSAPIPAVFDPGVMDPVRDYPTRVQFQHRTETRIGEIQMNVGGTFRSDWTPGTKRFVFNLNSGIYSVPALRGEIADPNDPRNSISDLDRLTTAYEPPTGRFRYFGQLGPDIVTSEDALL